MTPIWFLDTGFAIAMISPRDQYHGIARQLSERIEMEGLRLITSQAVILEIGAALSRLAFRQAAAQLIDAMQADPVMEIVMVDAGLMQRAFEVFKSRPDKEWSLADCISFEIMRERNVTEALTADLHFAQAGWVALMRL